MPIHRTNRRQLLFVLVAATLVCGLIAVAGREDRDDAEAASGGMVAAAGPAATSTTLLPAAPPVTDLAAPDSSTPQDPATSTSALPDLDGSDLTVSDGCVMKEMSVRLGTSGESVLCLQRALESAGHYSGAITGEFDAATDTAVRAMQAERELFVDGVVGRETALSLSIWPDESSLVVRTPAPPAGATDLMGYPLSSVASAGSNAPALPANSGSGRRIVYDRAGQRVWAVDDDGQIIRSWLVSGSKYSNELPGTHQVYSRSDVSTAWNGKAYLPQMVRWLKTDIGAIGFHAIPLHVEDNSPYQTEAELGTRLSGGCQRQANRDADFLWNFAQVGTTVVVT